MAYTTNNHRSNHLSLRLLSLTLLTMASSAAASPTPISNPPQETHQVNANAGAPPPGFIGVEGSQAPSPPAYTPITTPAPDQDAALESQGYYQTTYYTCRTLDGREEESCGWHVPVLKIDEAAAPPANAPLSTGVVAAAVGAGAALFAFGLL